MSVTPNFVPREYKTVTVSLVVKDIDRALKFYNAAFEAEIVSRLVDPTGKVVHAEIRKDDTIIMLSPETDYQLSPESTGSGGVVLQLYTGDVEGLFESAVSAGAEVVFPIKEQFYGDRAGRVKDPFGYQWILATHVEDLSPQEISQRFHELYL